MGAICLLVRPKVRLWGLYLNGGRSSGVRAPQFQSEPWWGRVRKSFVIPPNQLRLVYAWPPPPLFVCKARTQICAHVKDPISFCRKRISLTAGSMETSKHCTPRKKTEEKNTKKIGSAVLWLLAFPGESSTIFRALHWDKKVSWSNLTDCTISDLTLSERALLWFDLLL